MKWFDAILDVWFYLGLAMIGVAILIFVAAFLRYARKKMSDGFMMVWFLISIVILVLGVVLIAVGYSSGMMVAVTASVCVLLMIVIFFTSSMVSELMMKVRELAMQVALLNQENDSMLQQINKLKEQEKDV